MKLQFDSAKVDIDFIFEAEDKLREAGVTFYTGMDISEPDYPVREWFLDGIGEGYNVIREVNNG